MIKGQNEGTWKNIELSFSIYLEEVKRVEIIEIQGLMGSEYVLLIHFHGCRYLFMPNQFMTDVMAQKFIIKTFGYELASTFRRHEDVSVQEIYTKGKELDDVSF